MSYDYLLKCILTGLLGYLVAVSYYHTTQINTLLTTVSINETLNEQALKYNDGVIKYNNAVRAQEKKQLELH